MPGEFMHILHQHDLILLYRCAADPGTHLDLYAGRLPLERPQHQFTILHEIESGPVDIGQCLI